jgi:hypothetical protein
MFQEAFNRNTSRQFLIVALLISGLAHIPTLKI